MITLLALSAFAATPDEALARARAYPDDVEVQEQAVDTLVGAGQRARIRDHVIVLLQDDPDDPDRWYLLARAGGLDDDAEPLLREALRLDGSYARAYLGLGRIEARRGDWLPAAAWLRTAVSLDPDLGEAQVALAEVLRSAGRPEEALDVAQRAADAGWPRGWALVATLGDDPAGAVETGLEIAPDDPELLAMRADLALRRGDLPSAVIDAEAALAGGSPQALARQVLAGAHCLSSGTLDRTGYTALADARTTLLTGPTSATVEHLVARHPDCPLPWTTRAAVRHREGREAEALADLERAARVAPDDPEVAAALGLARLRTGRAVLAREALATASEARPDDIELALLRAEALRVSGVPREALVQLEALRLQQPYHPGATLALADLLWELGERQASYETLRNFLARAPDDPQVLRQGRNTAAELGKELDLDTVLSMWKREVPIPAAETDTADTMIVIGRRDAATKRAELDRRLAEIGYDQGKQRDDYTLYKARGQLVPWLKVYDDGRIDLQESGLISTKQMAPQADGGQPIPVISKRKMAPRRDAVIRQISPQLHDWREALAVEGMASRLQEEIPLSMIALWEEGEPLDGSDGVLESMASRRRALLVYWATRTCSSSGDAVREAVERFLQLEVQVSEHPVTPEEIATANAACVCQRQLELTPD